VKYKSGKQASIAGTANEHIVLGILLPEFPDAMLSSHQQSSHDMIIPSGDNFIRAQIKTANKSISFSGGGRGGIDRTYIKGKNNPKTYTYSTIDTDVVIGIEPIAIGSYDLFFVPSLVIERLGKKSISNNKVAFTKNNFDYLVKSKDMNFCNEMYQKLTVK
jgi:hypothetical protein